MATVKHCNHSPDVDTEGNLVAVKPIEQFTVDAIEAADEEYGIAAGDVVYLRDASGAGRRTAERLAEAEPRAAELERLNRERRSIDDATEEAAVEKAERQITARSPHALVLYDEDWHLGVIGIVASSVVERLDRKSVV